jgi:hypothetical protein
MAIMLVDPTELKVERLQTRATTNSLYIDEIAERMQAGDEFPPIIVFQSNGDAWLSDGVHRLDGAIKSKTKLSVDLRTGTREQAVEFACGANKGHGLKRTREDKRRSVVLALATFPDRSSRAIAELCGVADSFVGDVRKSTAVKLHSEESEPKTRVGRDGKRRPATNTTPPKPPGDQKPKQPGDLKADVRVWDAWKSAFGKARRILDDLDREFPHHNLHEEAVGHLNSAWATTKQWKRAVR